MPGFHLSAERFEEPLGIRVSADVHNGRVGMHDHDFYEFVYISDGFTLHSVGGSIHLLLTGDLLFIRPGEQHSYINAYQTKLYNINFYPQELGSLYGELREVPGLTELFAPAEEEPDNPAAMNTRILHIPMQMRHTVEAACTKMETELQEKQAGWKPALRARLASFLLLYARLHAEQWKENVLTAGDYYGYVYKILQYVDAHYRDPIPMQELSDVTGLSPDYMTRKFKSTLHMTPSEYIRKYRIAQAMELLCTTELPVAQVAEQTGFSDVSLFSRVFKQYVGLPPVLYRKRSAES